MNHKKICFLLFIGLIMTACGKPTPPPPMPEPKEVIEALPAPVVIKPATVQPTVTIPPTTQSKETPLIPPAGTPEVTPLIPPPPGSQGMMRGHAFPDVMALNVEPGTPAKVSLRLKGDLPTPCHILQVDMAAPDSENRIQIEVYSLVDPNKMCAQVLVPFEQELVLGSFSGGRYSVLVNGQQVGEFDSE
jgi:hypothetical protein